MRTSPIAIFVCALSIIALAAGISGCGKKSKCAEAIDHAFELSMAGLDQMKGLTGDLPPEAKKQLEEGMAKQKEAAVKQCEVEYKKDPAKSDKALDCVIGAKNIGDLSKCGADFVKGG